MVLFTTFLVTCLRFHVLWVDTVPFEMNNQTGQRDVIFSDLFDLSRFDRWGNLADMYTVSEHHQHTHTHTYAQNQPHCCALSPHGFCVLDPSPLQNCR